MAHTTWECVHRIVWIPKYRGKAPYGGASAGTGEILRNPAGRMGGVENVGGALAATTPASACT